MPTLEDVVSRLLPKGSTPWIPGKRSWTSFPPWPPDLFAVAATLVELSGCYASAGFGHRRAGPFGDGFSSRTTELGLKWRMGQVPARELDLLWQRVRRAFSKDVGQCLAAPKKLHDWAEAALELMAIADEASSGLGFSPGDDQTQIAGYFAQNYWAKRLTRGHEPRGVIGANQGTVCWFVPDGEVCVQPKATTPQTGCTLRSLSHHLALLPSKNVVSTRWWMRPEGGEDVPQSLNILLIPYPYYVGASAFIQTKRLPCEGWANVLVDNSTWLPRGSLADRNEKMSRFLEDLVRFALQEVDTVHGVVLPELALPRDMAAFVAKRLRSKFELDFFISGVTSTVGTDRVRNEAFFDSRYFPAFSQSKHHRWRLDKRQIDDYHLSMKLDRNLLWWEDIDISGREVSFYQCRDGACLAVLICEDLARVDPVQPVLRAVGPNLVVGLLMDGPQVPQRWPGRYATVLADDPGSAVLTLTSVGMVRRYPPKFVDEDHLPIGLWKDVGGTARSVTIPSSAHASLLKLSIRQDEQRSLDRRSDGRAAQTILMDDADPVPIAHPSPPRWLGNREPPR